MTIDHAEADISGAPAAAAGVEPLAAERLAQMDESLLVAGLSSAIRVLDLSVFAPIGEADGGVLDVLERARVEIVDPGDDFESLFLPVNRCGEGEEAAPERAFCERREGTPISSRHRDSQRTITFNLCAAEALADQGFCLL